MSVPRRKKEKNHLLYNADAHKLYVQLVLSVGVGVSVGGSYVCKGYVEIANLSYVFHTCSLTHVFDVMHTYGVA